MAHQQVAKPYDNMLKLWEGFSKQDSLEQVSIELEVYKKLLTFFQVGDYYSFIFNFTTLEIDTTSQSVKDVLGYEASEITMQFWFSLVHPDDQLWYNKAEQETAKFLLSLPIEKIPGYKIQYDFRVKRKDGNYRRILIQVVTIQQYEDGGIQRTLSLHTDITHLRPEGTPILSFIGLDGEPSYIDVKVGNPLLPFKQLLSKREKEILMLIMNGRQNKEIAQQLYISKQTVDKHRKNMLVKTGCHNSNELIAKAIKNGWV